LQQVTCELELIKFIFVSLQWTGNIGGGMFDPLTRIPLHNGVLGSADADKEDSADVSSIVEQFSEEEIREISRLKDDPKIYKRLIHSIAPAVFGKY
jgi:hypothetical protein